MNKNSKMQTQNITQTHLYLYHIHIWGFFILGPTISFSGCDHSTDNEKPTCKDMLQLHGIHIQCTIFRISIMPQAVSLKLRKFTL